MQVLGRGRLAFAGVASVLAFTGVAAGCSAHTDGKAASAPVAAPPAFQSAPRGAAPGASTAKPPVDLAVAKRPGGDRQVISTAQLTLEARNIDDAVQRATTLVTGARGYVFSETANLASRQHAHVVFKVEPGEFASVVRDIGKLGTLTQREIATQDVTGQVVDLDARLSAAQTSADRLRQLLANSGGVADLLSVEQQLTTRDGQVDALSGELAALRAQVDMATVTLDVAPVTKRSHIATPHHEKPGFARGLRAGATAFANTARLVEAAVGILLPFSPLLVLALAGWWIARRRTSAAPGAS